MTFDLLLSALVALMLASMSWRVRRNACNVWDFWDYIQQIRGSLQSFTAGVAQALTSRGSPARTKLLNLQPLLLQIL